MKRYLFFTFLVIMFMCANVKAFTYYENTSINSFDDTDIVIANGVTISAQDSGGIAMYDVVSLYNNGIINGTIDTNGYNLYIYNTVDNATINVTGGGSIVQKISSDAQVTKLNLIGGSFNTQIENITNLNLSDIQNMNANSFMITDSSIVMDDFNLWQDWTKDVTLNGNISLIINDANTVASGTIINHTLGGATINVQIPNLDKLYKPHLEYNGSEVILRIIRETNYALIFDDGEGMALDSIRTRHPNDRLLMALDRAATIDEINRIKGLSYRFDHDIMLRPLKMLNKFSSMNLIKNENDSGAGFEPFYIMSDATDAMGGRIYVGYNYNNLYFYTGFNIGRFNYSDELNEFDGMFYGFDVKAKQTFDKFWLSQALGFSLSDFHADYISNNRIKNNPLALSGYGDVSMGYDFAVDKDVTLSPIVGFTYQPYKVADVSDTDSYFHGGADIKYSFAIDGIKYEYAADLAIGTNGDMFANAKIGFTSITDNAGASFNIGILKDDFDYYYRLSLDAKILF